LNGLRHVQRVCRLVWAGVKTIVAGDWWLLRTDDIKTQVIAAMQRIDMGTIFPVDTD